MTYERPRNHGDDWDIVVPIACLVLALILAIVAITCVRRRHGRWWALPLAGVCALASGEIVAGFLIIRKDQSDAYRRINTSYDLNALRSQLSLLKISHPEIREMDSDEVVRELLTEEFRKKNKHLLNEASVPGDWWERPLRFGPGEDGETDVFSAGADGKFGTADDVH